MLITKKLNSIILANLMHSMHFMINLHTLYSLTFAMFLWTKNMIGNPCYLIVDFWDMVECMEPSSSLQSTWFPFYKIIKKSQQSSSLNKIPIQCHMLFKFENLPHMQLVISLSFVKLLQPFVRYISYSYDHDHVHVSTKIVYFYTGR